MVHAFTSRHFGLHQADVILVEEDGKFYVKARVDLEPTLIEQFNNLESAEFNFNKTERILKAIK